MTAVQKAQKTNNHPKLKYRVNIDKKLRANVMKMSFSNSIGVLFLAVASTGVWATGAIAQTAPSSAQPIRLETIPDAFNRAFFNYSGDFYTNRTLLRQATYIIGPGSLKRPGFADNEFFEDAKILNTLYRDALEQQISSDPIIRTPDLPNPFNTSIRFQPSTRSNLRVRGSEFVYETLPLR